MNLGNRRFLMTTFSALLAFAGCDGKKGLSAAGPDSGTPVPGNPNPDTAEPIAALDAPLDGPTQPVGTAILTVKSPSVDVDCVDVGETSSPVVVTVTNAGTVASGPLNVTVTGDGIMATGCAGTVLAPKATCTILIRAQRQTEFSPVSGSVDVGDSSANSQRIAVISLCKLPGLMFALSTDTLDLGSLLVGKSASGTIVLTNHATWELSNIVIAVSGVGFSLSPGTCTDTLAAGQSCNIVVTYTAGPTLGPAQGTVSVNQSGAIKTAAVTATVWSTGSTLQLTPKAAPFTTEVGTASPPATFYVTGDLSSAPVIVTITGSNKDDFSFRSSCSAITAGATSCEVTVVYNPKTAPAANSTAMLTVSSGASSSATATLTGTVTPRTTPANPVDAIPVDNTISGWMIDPDNNVDGSKKPMTATTMEDGGRLIDGGIDPFYGDGFSPRLFIWQNFYNTHLPAAPVDFSNPKGASIALYVFRMPSAAQASGLYTNLLKYSEYARKKTETSSGWEEPTAPLIGTKSRIQDTGSDWFINFQKNEYYVEIKLTPSNGPAPDFTPGNLDMKKEALRFAQSVAARL